MPGTLALSRAAAATLMLAATGALAILGGGLFAYRSWLGSRVSPSERERRRRAELVAHGKMGDATLVEVRDGLLFYSYDVRGVEYTASQDIALLEAALPPEFSVSGPVVVRYDARNPANSIVVSEQWSGLRTRANSA